MKKNIVLFIALFVVGVPVISAQGERSVGTGGCTDPTASNYNQNAVIDDGSCVGGDRNAEIQRIQTENAQRSTNTVVPQTSGFVPLAPIPGLTDIQPTQEGLAGFFNNLYKYLIGLAATLAIIMIIWGGLEYSTQDNISKKSDGKQRIYDAILGLVLVLSPVLVFSIINPSILNLSINLKQLDTKSSPPVQNSPPKQSLPTCSGALTTNCIPKDAVVFNEGTYTTPPPGAYCFKYNVKTLEGAKLAGGENFSANLTPYYCAKNFGIINDTVQACRSALVGTCPTIGTTVSADGSTIAGPCPVVASGCTKY